MMNSLVTQLIQELNHPFIDEINLLRKAILSTSIPIEENIKWNGPNYIFEGSDRITMRIQPPKKQVQLIFHRGAAKQEQPKNRLINDEAGLLIWKENDRAILTFNSLQQIDENTEYLKKIIVDWIETTRRLNG